MFYVFIFTYFIEKETEGKALFHKEFCVNKVWKTLHPGWTPKMNTYISENRFPEVSQAGLTLAPFCGLQLINILASHACHPSLEVLQYHFMASKDFPEWKP